MKISFAEPALPAKGAVVVLVEEGKKLSPAAKDLDKQTKGAVKRAIAASKFVGKKGQSLEIMAPAGGSLDRVLLAGTGKAQKRSVDATIVVELLDGNSVTRLGELKIPVAKSHAVRTLALAGLDKPGTYRLRLRSKGAAGAGYQFAVRYHTLAPPVVAGDAA